MLITIVLVSIVVLWGGVSLLLVVGDSRQRDYGMPFKVAALWPLLFFTDKVTDRVMGFNHRIDSAKENLRVAIDQFDAARDAETVESREWHFNVARGCVQSAREWLITHG